MSIDELLELEGPLDIVENNTKPQSNRKSLRFPKDKDKDKVMEDNRYYLPILHLNDPSVWEPKPLSERLHFTDEIAKETCMSNCCGYPGVKNACCLLDPEDLEHVLGPVDEPWIKKMILWYKKKGIHATRSDIVIDYEEGKLIGEAHFNGHRVFMAEDSYPILRIQAFGQRFACKFLNVHNGKCGIYSVRSDMCRNYLCSYVSANFLVKTPKNPGTYKKVK
jgi:Fe-S-cluster containining protein